MLAANEYFYYGLPATRISVSMAALLLMEVRMLNISYKKCEEND